MIIYFNLNMNLFVLQFKQGYLLFHKHLCRFDVMNRKRQCFLGPQRALRKNKKLKSEN